MKDSDYYIDKLNKQNIKIKELEDTIKQLELELSLEKNILDFITRKLNQINEVLED